MAVSFKAETKQELLKLIESNRARFPPASLRVTASEDDTQVDKVTKAMTFNIHSLLHVGESVRRSGPMWGTSAFPFENGIFYDKLNVNGLKGVSIQMSRKRLKKIQLRSKINASTTSNECANYCHKLFEPEENLKNCVELPNNIRLIGEKLKTSQVEKHMKNYLQNQNI